MHQKRELVFDLKRQTNRPAIEQAPVLSSSGRPWEGILIEQCSVPSMEFDEVFCLNDVMVLQLNAPITLEWKHRGGFRPQHILPGQVSIFPSRFLHSSRCREQCQLLSVSLERDFLRQVAEELDGQNRFELVARQGVTDPLILGIGLALKSELESGAWHGPLYVESLATSLAAHLLQKYAASPRRFREYSGRLPNDRLHRAIEFINDRLSGDISLSAMAAVAGMSRYHFIRLFKKATGYSPYQYLLRRRLQCAKQVLLSSGATISDTACRLGFYDQSHFTYHFKRLFGMTPRVFLQMHRPDAFH